MRNYLDDYVVELLHIADAKHNKLIDLQASDPAKTLLLSREDNHNFSEYMLLTVAERIGKLAQTMLSGSALTRVESRVGRNLSHLDWKNGCGRCDAEALDRFIRETYQNISFKGINPLFLSVGALRWQIRVSQTEFREVLSPLLIFPVKLVRSVSSTPVAIEFVDDDIYFNPCLYQKMLATLPAGTAEHFPHPNGEGASFDDPIDLSRLGDGNAYFAAVEAYVKACRGEEDTVAFDMIKDTVAIAQYEHSDLCMYYDYLRNRDRIREHPLVRAVFDPDYEAQATEAKQGELSSYPYFVLPHDSVQEDMILRALNGESMVIKGPPGTGKTVTIANMISALMAERKKVLLVSSKISALSEVYHKLPEELRKFALLLDYESEAQAAKIAPGVIKKDLAALVEAAAHPDRSDHAYEERNHARADHGAAVTELAQYHKLAFEVPVIVGESYTQALERVCRHPEAEVIQFDTPQRMLGLTRDGYHALLDDVRDVADEFETLSEGGTALISRNPWYGVTERADLECASAYYDRIGELADCVQTLTGTEWGADAPSLLQSLGLFACVRAAKGKDGSFDAEALKRATVQASDTERLEEALAAFAEASEACPEAWRAQIATYAAHPRATELGERIASLVIREELTLEELRTVYEHQEVFADARGIVLGKKELDAIASVCERIGSLTQAREKELFAVWEVFRKTEDEAVLKKLHDAVPTLQKYSETGAEAPGVLDLKAKLAVKSLLPLCYLSDTPFSALVGAIAHFGAAEARLEELEEAYRALSHLYKREMTDAERATVLSGIRYKSLLEDRGAGFAAICASYPAILSFATAMDGKDTETVHDLKCRETALRAYRALCETVAGYEVRAGLAHRPDCAVRNAELLCAWYEMTALCREAGEAPETLLACVQSLSGGTVAEIERLLSALDLFGKEFFDTYYTACADRVTFSELAYFAARCRDRSFANAAVRYSMTLGRHAEVLPLASFFRPFEYGELTRAEGLSLEDYFEHSVFSLATGAYRTLLAREHRPMGRAIAQNYEKIERAEEETERLNRRIIEKKLLAYIHPEDKDYRFLGHERGANMSVRKLFTENVDAIRRLKSCMIMSPSTASVLLRHPDYAGFDTVIIDEASQMPSVTLLPVLSRAGQCVIVGDEWQMPPIKHFESRIDTRAEREGGERPEDSALSLVLKNAPFHVATLVCHYRSRTESLIKFSQERFYPVMRTFPSPEPRREDLGFTDLYVEDGVCQNGVNEQEAQRTVACLREHFKRYYDPETKRLTRSFGVVTFGVPQLERIKSIIKHDREFRAWEHTAERREVDDPFFYCTVETVQGQETTDLYLSMTYTGHSSLNQNELGSQVFNVAVSRATDRVTVIHSVKAMDAKPDYVRRYLEIVERFASEGESGFVSAPPTSSFLRLLCRHITTAYGIDPSRVICDYGATEGSVRIPLVILSPDGTRAELGLFCETPESERYHYLDYHVRYYGTLCRMRGWKLHRVFLHDWVEEPESEKKLLDRMIRECVTLETIKIND